MSGNTLYVQESQQKDYDLRLYNYKKEKKRFNTGRSNRRISHGFVSHASRFLHLHQTKKKSKRAMKLDEYIESKKKPDQR